MKHPFLSTKKFLSYAFTYLKDRPDKVDHPLLPKVINLPITDNCNSRCVMCDVWKTPSEDELCAEELGAILQNRLFAEVQHVGISGGEPTLRKDLVNVVEEIVGNLPKLKGLSITTHGFNLKRHERFLEPILKCCQSSGVSFHLSVSIDGVAEAHDAIRGIPNGFNRSLECVRMATGLGIPVQIQSTISKDNVYQLEALSQLAEEESVEIIFRKATLIPRLENQVSIEETGLGPDGDSFFVDYIESNRCKDLTPSPSRGLWYRDLAYRLRFKTPRKAPCAYQNEGVLLSAHGDLYHCSISTESFGNAKVSDAYELYYSDNSKRIRKHLLSTTCPGCIHDQAGRWSPLLLVKQVLLRSRMGKWLKLHRPRPGYYIGPVRDLIRIRSRYSKSALENLRITPAITKNNRQALLIGCYGGEHVGDAAILAGVCMRLTSKFGIEQFHVLSIRKHRTERWVRSIKLSENIHVHEYEMKKAGELLPEMDLVALAGGPLMELPGLIERHLAVASITREAGIPFIVEGIGYGPFRKGFSNFIAKGILKHATEVTVRSKADKEELQKAGLIAECGNDPAFDYLATRMTQGLSTHLPDLVKQLFESKKPIVSINLRPLWEVYSSTSEDGDSLPRLTDRVLEVLTSVILQRSDCFRFLFIPFNTDQFGFSDLRLGLDLKKRIGTQGDFAVVEFEPGIDDCVWMLKKSSGLIAMRFHACIFGLSAGLPVCGLDYAVGEKGKVSHLMSSQDETNLLIPISQIAPGHFHDFLDSIQPEKT